MTRRRARFWSSCLGRIGYHAFATGEGKAGLEWLAGQRRRPQAVLLDFADAYPRRLRGAAAYRAEGGTAPVIALSAMDEKEAVVKAMRLGRERLPGEADPTGRAEGGHRALRPLAATSAGRTAGRSHHPGRPGRWSRPQ